MRRALAAALAFAAGCGHGALAGGDAPRTLPPVPHASQPLNVDRQIELEHLVQQGLQAQHAGRYQRAAALYREAIVLAPREARPRLGLAEAWLMLGVACQDDVLRKLGCQAARQASQLQPGHEHARYLASICSLKQLGAPAANKP